MTQQGGTPQGQGVAQPPYPREPNVHSGGEQEPGGDRELPPYSDRQTSGQSQEQLEENRVGPGHDAGPRDISQTEQQGVGDTDLAPQGPHAVGQSTTTSGNEIGRGMSEDSHTKDRLDSGLSDLDSKATDSPATSSGDQGG